MVNKIEIIVGTSNPHKIREFNLMSCGHNVCFLPLSADIEFEPKENGKTFRENAEIKAKEASKVSRSGVFFLADDSGLCVDYLKGAPGVRSARYEKTPEKRIKKLLKNMENDTARTARFVCALCLVNKKGEILYEKEGKVEGKIGYFPKGEGGFGYDPVFIPEGLSETMAELSEDRKNTLSHRGMALKNMLEWIETNEGIFHMEEEQQYKRWYDKDPVLREALELLRLSAPEERKEAQDYILKLQEEVAADVIERIYEIVKQYSGKGNRWYDSDPVMLRTMEILRHANPKTQRIAALKILLSLEEKKENKDE